MYRSEASSIGLGKRFVDRTVGRFVSLTMEPCYFWPIKSKLSFRILDLCTIRTAINWSKSQVWHDKGAVMLFIYFDPVADVIIYGGIDSVHV